MAKWLVEYGVEYAGFLAWMKERNLDPGSKEIMIQLGDFVDSIHPADSADNLNEKESAE